LAPRRYRARARKSRLSARHFGLWRLKLPAKLPKRSPGCLMAAARANRMNRRTLMKNLASIITFASLIASVGSEVTCPW
jgi:hypothetical protein